MNRIEEVVRLTQEPVSLKSLVGNKEDTSLENYISNDDAVSPEEAVIDLLLRDQIRRVLETLSDQSRSLSSFVSVSTTAHRGRLKKSAEFSGDPERVRQVEEKSAQSCAPVRRQS